MPRIALPPRRRPAAGLLHLAALVLLLAALGARSASAQPLSFQLKNDVPQGKKPSLWLVAIDRVENVKLSLTRDDGETFTAGLVGLASGQKATLDIGDGRGGKATWKGTLSADVPGPGGKTPWSFDLSFETLVRAPITVTYDYDHLDVGKRTLKFQMSRPAGRAELVAYDEDGVEMGRGEAKYKKEPPGTWLTVGWTPSPEKPGAKRALMRLALRAESSDKLATNVELFPWQVSIPHEDVAFATGSHEVTPTEARKLDESLVKINETAKRAERFVKVKLYVAGHTDTVGNAASNHELSHKRARSLAEYFRRHGLTIPIVYNGFGEDVLRVQTADGVDEAANRRADYVVGAVGAQPPLPGDWKTLP